MADIHPRTIPNCPECGHDVLRGVEKIGVTIHTDGDGGIDRWNVHEPLNAFTTLACDMCGDLLIQDGEIVDEAVDETDHGRNSSPHET